MDPWTVALALALGVSFFLHAVAIRKWLRERRERKAQAEVDKHLLEAQMEHLQESLKRGAELMKIWDEIFRRRLPPPPTEHIFIPVPDDERGEEGGPGET